MNDDEDLSGLVLAGWTLADRIGAGGMGAVWRAQDRRKGTVVAVKVLPSHLADEPEFLSRFRRECQSQATLNHPNLVKVISSGFEQGFHFLVMEYVPGRTLASVLRDRRAATEAMAAHAGKQLFCALEYVHERDLIHRDIKPGNIFLTSGGHVKLMDFGLVKDLHRTMITVAGEKVGTPRYMAPEALLQGLTSKLSDIYQVALVLYEMLTLRIPYEDPKQGNFLNQICNVGPTPPQRYRPDLSDRMAAFLMRGLSFAPDERFRAAREARQELEALGEDASAAAPPARPEVSHDDDTAPSGWPVVAPVAAKKEEKKSGDEGEPGTEPLPGRKREPSIERYPAKQNADPGEAAVLLPAGGPTDMPLEPEHSVNSASTVKVRPRTRERPRTAEGTPRPRIKGAQPPPPAPEERTTTDDHKVFPEAAAAPPPAGAAAPPVAQSPQPADLPEVLVSPPRRTAWISVVALVLGLMVSALVLVPRQPREAPVASPSVLSSGQSSSPAGGALASPTRGLAPIATAPQGPTKIGAIPLPPSEREEWAARLAALPPGPEPALAWIAEYAARHGASPLREPVLGPLVVPRLTEAGARPAPEQFATLDRSLRESPLAWHVIADGAAEAGAPARAALYELRGATWLLACEREHARALAPPFPAALERLERANGAPEWGALEAVAVAETCGLAVPPSPPATGEVASIARDSELAGTISRMRDWAREARDGRAGSPSESLKGCCEQFREMLYQLEAQKRRLEWGNGDEAGPAALVREMCAVVPPEEGAVHESSYRTYMLSFARTLKGAEAGDGGDAGYWEARAAVHRVLGDVAAEELALVRWVSTDYRRPEKMQRDPERRALPRLRLLDLLRARAESGGALEPLPAPWPAATRAEIRLRRALLVAVWAVAAPPDPAVEPDARRAREKQSVDQLRELCRALGEDDAARAREKWAAAP